MKPRSRRGAAVALTLAVAALHLWLAGGLLEDRLGSGAAADTPRRIEVAFVRELAPAAPPPVVAAAPRPKPRRPPPVVAEAAPAAASAPEVAASAPEPAPVVAEAPPASPEPSPAPEPVADAASAPAADTAPVPLAAASAPESAASAAVAFEWPPSTRISYALTGWFRGPVEGQAQVEWLRTEDRYQVRLEVQIGPSFAPLVTRRFTSDGLVREQGLAPRRYDEETKVPFRDPRTLVVRFDDETVALSNGRSVPAPPGVQDTASQFVQLTYLFTTRPDLLQPGRSVEIPLALPRSVSLWTYDVVQRETLYTDFGPVETVHVKPRREPKPGVEMTVELWIAPTLQYLPVRSRIRADAETWADLMITRLPQQAAPAPR
ncbi:MAG: DUF3108 domain-containing protein [Rubrivivax sp.]